MLDDKWIISEKEPAINKPGFLYTLLLVDCDVNNFKTDQMHIVSSQNLNIGDFVDSNLNPLKHQYNPQYSDVATVEMAHISNTGGDDTLKKVSFFGDHSGCFNAFIITTNQEFPIRRGDIISAFMFKKLNNPLNIDKDPHSFTFKQMENLTLGLRSPNYEYIYNNYAGDFEDIIVTGIGSAGINEEPAKKTLLVYSKRFGYVLYTISSAQTLFFTEAGDKLLVQRKPGKTAYDILQNITVDAIRTYYLLQR